ncbi:Dyp-type peroxidase [Neptunomonas marina]|uniref:Dyp-type peroxidase n=1 Tax=Neptunomonas marina TaxID=1815562 RepID=A0A437Q4T9_9GAMM|nr:Dyp-type peroxidase [Neptunomonas marina]RVU29535.1 Dyp-type peroxidase [Neptunomonas marina]
MTVCYQSGVVAPASSDALFITLNVKAGQRDQLRAALSDAYQRVASVCESYADNAPYSVIAVGSDFWDTLFSERPRELTRFPELATDNYTMPATPADLFLHLRSNRRDVTFEMGKAAMQALGGICEVVEEVSGFRYLDNRDLTGFVDGTENPEGAHRAEVAVVGDEDHAFAGGSYIHVQRYIHDIAKWEKQPLKAQEDTYGRTKHDNIEYPSAEKPLSAHTKRASLKDEQGRSLELLRHSMPYGTTTQNGLVFVSYCRTPHNFTEILRSMMGQAKSAAGTTDKVLQFTQAVTGAAFFAPSCEWFESLA